MAEAAVIEPLLDFGLRHARRRHPMNTHAIEEQPKEINKSVLLNEIVQAYEGYIKIHREVKRCETEWQDLIENISLKPSSFDLVNVNWITKRTPFENYETDLDKYCLIKEKLGHWLIGSLRTYEENWIEQLLPIEISEAIAEIKTFRANWDGQNAEPVSVEAIESAEQLLTQLENSAEFFEPFADPEGGLGLEASKGEKSIYIIANPYNLYTYVLRCGETVHRGSKVSLSNMLMVLNALF